MGWFNDLIKERKKRNQAIFESSFKNISSSVFGPASKVMDPAHVALGQIFRYYRIASFDLPPVVQDFSSELDPILAKHGLLTKPVFLDGFWQRDNNEPILAFTKNNRTPVVLYPFGSYSYYFLHPQTGKKHFVTAYSQDRFEKEAITFYRPLEKKKMTLRDYHRYIFKSINVFDVILVVALSLLVLGLGMVTPYLTRILMGEVIDNVDFGLFWPLCFALAGVALAIVLVKATQAIINNRVCIKVENSMHSSTMMHLLSLPPSFFKNHNTGELNSRLNSISRLCNLLINGVLIGGLSALLSVAYLFQIASFSLDLVLPSAAVVVATFAWMAIQIFAERNLMRRQIKAATRESGVAYDIINGIQKIRLTGSESRAFAKWAESYTVSARTVYNPPLLIKVSAAFIALIAAVGGVLIYYLAAKNNLDSASYYAFYVAYGSLSGALLSLDLVVTNIVKIGPLLEMISPILEAEPESNEQKKQIEDIEGSVRLDHVSFRYSEELPLVLDDLSLNVRKGEYVAIVGKTGCGKSTIVRLLLGFEQPEKGHVYYDDHNLEELDLPSLRRKIGSVTQNGALFHADIFHNITISAPELQEADAWEAARIANINEDIKAMPMGMHTVISEGQGSISGGQKQRIMIARAVVHKPRIIIFDEATSALDNRCQKAVTEAIGKLNCTRIVIAHRLSTIKDCDRILYLEGGKVVEEGNYDQLMELNGRFKELIERQKID